MKKIILLFLFLLGGTRSFSQSTNWIWARSGKGDRQDEGYSTSVDSHGNIYTTGGFQSYRVIFGTDTLTNSPGWGGSEWDIFLVKYDSSGNVLWAKSAGGSSTELGFCVKTDTLGNVFVTGKFYSPKLIIGNDTLINKSNTDVFIAKYDFNGNPVWARSGGGTGDEEGINLITDNLGNVYVTGKFNSTTINFGTTTLVNSNTNSSWDIFICKYDSLGNLTWAKKEGGTSLDMCNGISIDLAKNIYLTGQFGGTYCAFGNDTLFHSTYTWAAEFFLAKLDSSGQTIWTKSAPCTQGAGCSGMGVCNDLNGNIYATGYFRDTSISFGTHQLSSPYNNINNSDMFLVKYDTTGVALWATIVWGTDWEMGYNLAVDPNGYVYVTGSFSSPVIKFDNDSLAYPSGATDPLFLLKYDPYGKVLCSTVLASGGDDMNGIAIDKNGNVYVSGDFYGVNPFILGNDSLYLGFPSAENAFLAKYRCTQETYIESYKDQKEITIYPNPTSDQFFIETNAADKLNVDLHDVNGRHVFSASVSDKENINIAILDNGAYTLTIKTADRIINKRLVILR